MEENSKVLLKMTGITKRFPGTLALDNVDFTAEAGKVHVLLGENGAGKSTLVKIIAGVFERDSGEIRYDGECVNYRYVREAQNAGISIIHQELNLLPERSIAQNIYIGREPIKKGCPGIVDRKKMMLDSKALLEELGIDLRPGELVKNLSIAQQQMVEVVKALSYKMKLLIMDEPTSSLTSREIDKLFEMIALLKKQGVGIIYISHRMDEIRRVGDTVTIMCDGRIVDTVDAKTMNMDEVVAKMVGRKIQNLYQRNYNEPGRMVLNTNSLTGLRFRNVSISVRAGEIVSISGLVGAGRSELAKALFGYEPIEKGDFELFNQKIRKTSPQKSVKMGMALLPENRKSEGLVLKMSVQQNVVAASLRKWFPGWVVRSRVENDVAVKYKNELRIATPNVQKLVGELSGGNQQKAVIAKWLATDCKFFIFDEPTRGIDVGAKAEIYQLLDKLAAGGAGILMISSELNEVIGLSDRVYVMRDGDVVAEFSHGELSQEALVAYAVGSKGEEMIHA